MMKKITALGLALVLLAGLCGSAAAEGSAEPWVSAWTELLFRTRNVTLEGAAQFSLDGAWFKTAEGTYIQDGMNSLWRLGLTSPRMDGTERESGYTVIANGEKIYVMEVFTPGVYRTGTDDPQSTVVRNTVQMNQMARMAAVLAEQIRPMLGDRLALSESELTLQLAEGQTPALLDSALNLFWEFGLKRLFLVDYDMVPAEQENREKPGYITPFMELTGSTREIRLRETNLRMTKNGTLPETAEGSAVLDLTYTDGSAHTLEILFRGTAYNVGSSMVDLFDPADYGVSPAPDSTPADRMPEGYAVDQETLNMLLERAEYYRRLAGITKTDSLLLPVLRDGRRNLAELRYGREDGIVRLYQEIGMDGRLMNMTDTEEMGKLAAGSVDGYPGHEEEIRAAEEKLLEFLGTIDPEIRQRVQKLRLERYWAAADGTVLQFEEDPILDEENYVTFVVRTAPEWQIIHYGAYANG